MLTSDRLSVMPPLEFFSSERFHYFNEYPTYGYYNYLRPGVVQRMKRHRFEVALRLAEPWFHSSNAIDFGCADGGLLPSLSRHFGEVVGIDTNAHQVEVAQELCQALELHNMQVVRNSGKTVQESGKALKVKQYGVAFLLETLEHVGEQPDIYESKMRFLDGLLGLLRGDSVVIVSVPKMVGLTFLAKYIVQTALRMNHENYTLGQLRAVIPAKEYGRIGAVVGCKHKGFNHVKLEKHLADNFRVLGAMSTLTTRFYVVSRGQGAAVT